MRSLIAICAAVAAGALGGCGDDDGADGGPPQAIAFSRVGGIAGLSDRLEIEPDGAATLRSMVGGETGVERFEVSGPELEQLNERFDAAGFVQIESPADAPNCPDCFTYEITRGEHTVRGNDASLPEELRPVRDSLVEIVDGRGPQRITYSHAGGQTGGRSLLVIGPAGTATLTTNPPTGDDRAPRERFTLSRARLRRFDEAFDRAGFEELESPEPSGCADCVSSTLTRGDHTIRFDNIISGEHGSVHERLRPVLALLDETIADHLPADAPTGSWP